MAPFGQAATQYAALMHFSAWISAPVPPITARQPWVQTVPQRPQPITIGFYNDFRAKASFL
jgi:hypothetical protein